MLNHSARHQPPRHSSSKGPPLFLQHPESSRHQDQLTKTTTIPVYTSFIMIMIHLVTIHHITSRFEMLNSCKARSAPRSLRRTCKTARTTSGLHGSVPCIARSRVNCAPWRAPLAKGLRSCSKPEAPPIMPQGKSRLFFGVWALQYDL